MLHVSIHAGPLKEACGANRLDWLAIGTPRLGRGADYRVALFQVGRGPAPIVEIFNYPRWSASAWDLVARAIALGISATEGEPVERLTLLVPPMQAPVKTPGRKRPTPPKFADAESLCALMYHQGTEGTADRQVASMQITRQKKIRGLYKATVREDRRPDLA